MSKNSKNVLSSVKTVQRYGFFCTSNRQNAYLCAKINLLVIGD
jgi:hypothetical protein